MKQHQKNLIAIAALMMTSSVFAYSPSLNPCPPLALIKAHSTFRAAQELDVGPHAWGLSTAPFHFNNTEWQIGFGVILPDASSEADALAKGQEYFNTKVVLNDPINYYQSQTITVCGYSSPDEIKYIVNAVSPPQIQMSSFLRKFD